MNLTGKLLIAMPGMGDPRFEHSVIFVCSHGAEGAMGLIVNKPALDVSLGDLLKQLAIPAGDKCGKHPIHFGGPVEGSRGFVLHSCDYHSSIRTLEVSEAFGMTATLDVLEDIAGGEGPSKALILLGYAGWGPGQLEDEISRNGWLTADADTSLVFEARDTQKWEAALKTLGVDPLGLSSSAGHA